MLLAKSLRKYVLLDNKAVAALYTGVSQEIPLEPEKSRPSISDRVK